MVIKQYSCKLVPTLLLNGHCSGAKCGTCGWNPEVHKERLKKLHEVTARGKLREEWGKEHE